MFFKGIERNRARLSRSPAKAVRILLKAGPKARQCGNTCE